MPNPAPARSDHASPLSAHRLVWVGTGPTVAFLALGIGYALATHSCETPLRSWLYIVFTVAAIGCGTAAVKLQRVRRAHDASPTERFVLDTGAALALFCLLLVLTFALVTGLVWRCD
jgi:hypothetical protein